MGDKRRAMARLILLGFFCLIGLLVPASGATAAGFGPDFGVSNPLFDDNGSQGGAVTADGEGNFTYAWLQRQNDELTSLLTRVVSADGSAGPVNVIATVNGIGNPSQYMDSVSLSTGPGGQTHLAWALVTLTCGGPCVSQFKIKT